MLKFQQVFSLEEYALNNRYESFTLLMTKINKSIRKIKNIEMEEYKLKGVHVSILYYLYLDKELVAKELCDRCEEDKGTISRTLIYLEKVGLIKCDSKFKKKYNSPYSLTESGKEIAVKIEEKINRILVAVDDCLTPDERLTFYKKLSAISNSLEEINNNLQKSGEE